MRRSFGRRVFSLFLLFFIGSRLAIAKPRAPLPKDALDGGILSAETLGRGATVASNRPNLASGSQNPAALDASGANATYTTILLNTSSSLPDNVAETSDPLSGKVLQYISIGSERGIIFFEPLARREERQIINPASPGTDFRDVQYAANALGFAGATKSGTTSIGLSISYLNSSLASTEHASGKPDQSTLDTADGLRLNLGFRIPTGNMMWGLLVQNLPGTLWGSRYRHQNLPIRARIGNTWRIAPGLLFSADVEKRFYNEGSDTEDFVYLGSEWFASKTVVLRGGLFGTSVNDPKKRHATAGVTVIAANGTELSYAFDRFEETGESVKRSLVSVQFPFQSKVEEINPQ